MMFRKKSPEEIARNEAERKQAEERRRANAYAKTPGGKVHTAFIEGAKLFQITLPVTEVVGSTIDPFLLYGGQRIEVQTGTNETTLEIIESEGWILEHAGYVSFLHG
jgi:hypothetical protein